VQRLEVLASTVFWFAMLSAAALAQQLVIGSGLSMTGSAASLGILEKDTFKILPTEIAGVAINALAVLQTSEAECSSQTAKMRSAEQGTVVERYLGQFRA
jgi:branched-chain amino acid transport system substrate-binding protein